MATLRRSSWVLALCTFVSLLAIAAGVAVVLAPTPAEALPAPGTHVDYYDSPAYERQVGYRHYSCEGELENWWGVTSAHSISNTYGCTLEF